MPPGAYIKRSWPSGDHARAGSSSPLGASLLVSPVSVLTVQTSNGSPCADATGTSNNLTSRLAGASADPTGLAPAKVIDLPSGENRGDEIAVNRPPGTSCRGSPPSVLI